MKTAHFKAIEVELECGHIVTMSTSMYRLSKPRLNCIISGAVRRGVWCNKCNANCQLEKYLKTINIKERK